MPPGPAVGGGRAKCPVAPAEEGEAAAAAAEAEAAAAAADRALKTLGNQVGTEATFPLI